MSKSTGLAAETIFRKCWSCKGPVTLDAMRCLCCEALQPPVAHQSYYDLLGLPALVDIEPDRLEDGYQKALLKVHPDKFSGASAKEQHYATLWASEINAAYTQLSHPVESLIYWLKTKAPAMELPKSPSLKILTEIMELEEDLTDKKKKKEAVEAMKSAYAKALSSALQATKHADFDRAGQLVVEALYWSKTCKRHKVSL